jgi:hypothetical protein
VAHVHGRRKRRKQKLSRPRPPGPEVADILRDHAYGLDLTLDQERVVRDIIACRTAALGGHREVCTICGAVDHSYNSCRNRHCPKCQILKQVLWAEAQEARLLPLPYFHAIFTAAREVQPLFRAAPRVCYSLLFDTVADTLSFVARQKLKAEIGLTAMLHTWTQRGTYHPHLHCILPGGGLAQDGARFVRSGMSFFLPVRKLRFHFRKRLIARLKQAVLDGRIPFERDAALRLLVRAAKKTWVVEIKPPIDGDASHVVQYLSRYVSRVAIANSRIQSYDGKTVTFTYKDRKHNRVATEILSGAEFCERFLAHLLPPRFRRIRHYGLLASRRREDLARCRQLLGAPPAPRPNKPREHWAEVFKRVFGWDPRICRQCGRGRLVVIETLAPLRR